MSIKQTPATEAMQRYTELRAKAVEEWYKRYVEPLLDVGTPEKVIGKPYAEWTEQDMQLLAQVFGVELDNYILYRELKVAKELGNG